MANIMHSMSCALVIVSMDMLMSAAKCLDFHAGDLASDDNLWSLYERWLSLYSVQRLGMDEKKMRFNVFKDNVNFIHNFNEKGERPYKLRLNKFGDMTNQEFRKFYAGSMIDHHHALRGGIRAPSGSFMYENVTVVAPSVDWRLKGAVNAIKDQGQCGSCWAFSTIASTESINAIRTKKMVSLSEQELVDCDNTQNQGCNGGLMDLAFEFIEENGITSEQNYPYTAQDGTCDKTKRSRVVTIDGHEDVPANDETALMKAVMNQPVSVAIDASGNSFQFYSEGVFTGDCGTQLDHGVNVVGYGTTSNGGKYWIVWGESRYVKMARGVSGRGGLCGIAMQASYPIKNASPSSDIEMKDEL